MIANDSQKVVRNSFCRLSPSMLGRCRVGSNIFSGWGLMSAVLFSALFIFPSNLLCQEVSEAGTKNSGSTSENQNTKYTEYQNAVMFYILIPPYKAYGKDYPFLQREFMENCGIASPNETLEQIRGDLTIDEAKLELQWINDLWIKIKKSTRNYLMRIQRFSNKLWRQQSLC